MVLNPYSLATIATNIIQNEYQYMRIRGGRRTMGKTKSQKFDGCHMNSHFIGLELLRTFFGIAVACREGPVPAFSCIAGDIAGGISKNCFRAITFDWSVLRT